VFGCNEEFPFIRTCDSGLHNNYINASGNRGERKKQKEESETSGVEM